MEDEATQAEEVAKEKTELSVGESFIQCYYLSQRRNVAVSSYSTCDITGIRKMTLRDLIFVKKLACSISFLRLFYLKNLKDISMSSCELIDAVLAVMLFEIKRV